MTEPSSAIARLSAALADRYRIERELGAGGMATVYLAQDLRHDRKVAVKVLRPELAAVIGADRFLSEIKTTANLQHPHILPLFDSGAVDSFLFYVMPFVEGESLRDRLTREKQLPIADAVRIATEVAGALDYAHRHNVIHRDIKPENILLHDGRALVADFGIALAASKAGGTRMTETGMSLGTPTYMSPEQAMGERDITPKADIYALGCVLYETLVGEPPFTGPTAQAIVARVMTETPRSLTLQRHTIPPHVEAAVAKALEKLPADRFATAADLAAALEHPELTTASAAPAGRSARRGPGWRDRLHDPVVAGLAVVAVAAVAVAAVSLRRPAAPAPVVARFQVPLSAAHGITGAPINTLAFSPDGRMIVYVGRTDGGSAYALYERRLDELGEFRLIPGTQNATFPAFSPDGSKLAYIVMGKLFVTGVPFAGGAAAPLGSAGIESDVVWLDDRTLAVNNDSGGIDRIDLDGTVTHVARRNSTSGERNLWVWGAIPGGTLLAISSTGTGSIGRAFAVDPANGRRTPLLQTDVSALWYANGSLLWSLPNGTLQAAPYDTRGRRIAGSAVTLAEGVMQAIGGGGQVALSSVGSLVFLPEQAPDLVLLDRAGRSEVVGQGNRFHSPRISPDGGRVAFDFIQKGIRDVWTFDLRQRTLTRLSFENDGHDPVWSPDGRWVYYVHGAGMWRRRADGGGGADSVFTGAGQALEVERDGSVITATTISGSLVGGFDVGRWSPDSPRVVTPLLSSPYSEQAATLSPDRRWLAYASDETGRSEVYVRTFPEGGAKVLVSRGGGSEPQWSPDGRTLYYRGQTDGRAVILAAAVVPGAEFTIAARAPLFDVAEYEPAEPHRNWDVTPDGRRFAMVHQGVLTQMYVILNWPEEVRRQSASRSTTP